MQRGHAGAGAHGAQQVAHLLARLAVQRGERLVEKQHRRVKRQSSSQGHALGLTARQAARLALEQRANAQEVRQLAHPRLHDGTVPSANRQRERQVLGHGHGVEQGAVLRHIAESASRWRPAGHVALGQRDPAVGHWAQTADRLQDRRLAAAGLAHEGGVTAGRHVKRHIGERERTGLDRHIR